MSGRGDGGEVRVSMYFTQVYSFKSYHSNACVCMCDSQEVLAALQARMHDNECSDKRDHGCVEGKWNMKNKTNKQTEGWGGG